MRLVHTAQGAEVGRRAIARPLACSALLVALATTGCGDDADGAGGGDLAWLKDPVVFTPENLPDDRTMSGDVRNDSLRKIRVRAKTMAVVDAAGTRYDTAARFLKAYSHGLYPPLQRPTGADDSTQARLSGEYADLEPRQKAPLTVSWRTKPGMKPPLRLDYGDGALTIPAE